MNAGSSTVVEPMTLDDLGAVMAIDQASFPRPWPETSWRYEIERNTHARNFVARTTLPAAARRSWLRRLLPVKGTPAEAPSQVITGIACMWVVLDEAHLATIAAHPEYRGRKIGERVLAHCVAEARRVNCATMLLEVRVSNIAAQGLYRKYGFVVTGERKRYYSDNQEDAFLMNILDLQSAGYAAQLTALQAALERPPT
jgi:[ribosomal protein S18]-alanine N-acetyltransferase